MDTLADYEPLEYYTDTLRETVKQNAADYFDALVKRAGVSAKQNASLVSKYNAACAKAAHAQKKLNSCKVLRGFTIFFTVAAFLAAVLFFVIFFTGEDDWTFALYGGLCAALGVVLLVLLLTKLKKLLQLREAKYQKAAAAAEARKAACMEQLRPLHALFTWDMPRKIFAKTAPFIQLDEKFDVQKQDLLARKYGYAPAEDNDSSTVFVLSGSVDGNPFLFERKFRCTMGEKTYTGSIVIHWTTTSVDSEGHVHTQSHSQTLTASVTKPAPFYGYDTQMVYGNEAAPDLKFSRKPTHANELSEKQLEKKVKKGGKLLAKHSRRAIEEGRRFTEMASTEFEVLFGAADRNDEVQFRLLFTPLAQANMLDLIKSDDGYGDDFAFRKEGPVNVIRSEHAQRWQTEISPARFQTHDLAAARRDFIACMAEYFKSVFFDLAPVLALPLYRQQKPREFIYRDVYPANYTGREAEVLANRLGYAPFAHIDSKTDCILKARPLQKNGLSDRVAVTAYSFDTAERVDLVPMYGGDGRMHEVPVYWTEYLPVYNTAEMALKEVGGTREAFEGKRRQADLSSLLRTFAPGGNSAYGDGLIAFPLEAGQFDAAADAKLGSMFGIEQAASMAAFIVGVEAVKEAADILDKEEAKAASQKEGEEQISAPESASEQEAEPAADAASEGAAEQPASASGQKEEQASEQEGEEQIAAPASASEPKEEAPHKEQGAEEKSGSAADGPFAEFDTQNDENQKED